MMRRLLTAFLLGSLAPTPLAAQPATSPTAQSARADVLTTSSAGTEPTTAGLNPSQPPSAAMGGQRPALNFGVDEEAETVTGPVTLESGPYAVFHTSEGDILVRLFPDKAPRTVENFIALATGAKSWKHPVTLAEMSSPVYNNTTIYKTVENALLYGGDPINRGVGDPGFTVPLEFAPDLKFNEPGMLAMNLSGPNASGSRWILALRSFPDYTGRYPIFGKVVAGMDVARAISRKPARRPTVPLDPVLLNSVEIIQVPQGKTTTARYTEEEGKRFVTIEKEFRESSTPQAEPVAADSGMTASGSETTGPADSTAQDEPKP